MKKIFLAIIPSLILTACKDEVYRPGHTQNPGSEIAFSANLEKSQYNNTRTTYGEPTGTPEAFPIYWCNGDKVLLAGPQCSVKTAVYSISTQDGSTDQNYASAMIKVGDTGLQWGENLPQTFYSVYPESYTDINNDLIKNSFSFEGTDGKEAVASLNVRNYQIIEFPSQPTDKNWVGTPVDETKQKYPDALMYAQKMMGNEEVVNLRYIPFTTAFNIQFTGYDVLDGNSGIQIQPGDENGNPDLAIEDITIVAPTGVNLCGNFKAKFDVNCENAPVVDVTGNEEKEPNIIHVQLVKADGGYLTIKRDETINFNVFAIPVSNVSVSSEWKLRVRTTAGLYERSLTPASETSGRLEPGKIHKLVMPQFAVNMPITFDKATWMKQIPRNVYITDLSLPGAWYSRQVEYQGNEGSTDISNDVSDGTKLTVQEMWDAGVRAFSVETRSTISRSGLSWTHDGVVVSGTGSNRDNGGYGPETLRDRRLRIRTIMTNLIAAIRTKQAGYGVLVLQYADGGDGGHRASDYAYWLEGLYTEYNALSEADKQLIYGYNAGEEISENTTIGQVSGRLILQVNVAGNLPGGNITKGNYQDNLPAIFTYINKQREVGTAPIAQMHWKTWNDSYLKYEITSLPSQDMNVVTNALLGLNANTLYCNYTIANRTLLTDNASVALPTYDERYTAIRRIVRNSKILLDNDRYNMWNLIGAGGSQATAVEGGTTSALNFARRMNPWINKQIEDRLSNGEYAPFGIVLMNFITKKITNAIDPTTGGTIASFDSGNIVENIIKMNRLFRLHRNPNEAAWPDASNQSATPANYSSSHKDGGNAWTVQ